MKLPIHQESFFILGLLGIFLSVSCSQPPVAVDSPEEESVWSQMTPDALMQELMGPKYDDLFEGSPSWGKFSISSDHISRVKSTTISSAGSLNLTSASSTAYGISSSGSVTGSAAVNSQGLNHGFYWNGTSSQDLGALYSNSFESGAFAINVSEQVAGYTYIPSDNRYFASVWSPEDGLFNIGALSGSYSSMSIDVNDSGMVVGVAIQGSTKELFTWTLLNKVKKYGYPAASVNRQFNPTAINNLSIVTGVSKTIDGIRSYTWDLSNGFADLGSLGGTPVSTAFDLEVIDLNDANQYIGQATGLQEGEGAFFYDPLSGLFFLEDPEKPELSFEAHALNEDGFVAGKAQGYDPVIGDTVIQAFVWEATMGFQYLGFLGQESGSFFAISSAHDLNEEGGVTGMAINPNGQSEAVTWTFSMADLVPPELNYQTLATQIWPPNREMVLAVTGISAIDDRDGSLPVTIAITGSTDPGDMEVIMNSDGTQSIYLRAEGDGGRGRNRGERTYSIRMSTMDSAGNETVGEIQVRIGRN